MSGGWDCGGASWFRWSWEEHYLIPDSGPADWSRLAMEIHTETNLVRRDPAAYATHLEAMLPLRWHDGGTRRPAAAPHRGRRCRGAGGDRRAARPDAGAAARLVEGTGRRGRGPREGPRDRSAGWSTPAPTAAILPGAPSDAVAGCPAWPRTSRTARTPRGEVVIQLLVDDGVPDRGHRNNILDGAWGVGRRGLRTAPGLSADLCDGLCGEVRGAMGAAVKAKSEGKGLRNPFLSSYISHVHGSH